MRPDHWLKNLFIFFGSAAAWILLGHEIDFKSASLAIFCLVPACLVASANYIMNEILDAPFDRLHPTKHLRSVAAGTVKVGPLWTIMAVLLVLAFAIAWPVFNFAYLLALLLLFLSGIVYNVPPLRLKDRAFLDVIAESFNNPIRLWLGWYAISPPTSLPPLSVVLAWWMFGGMLMTGKRYSEYRFINDPELSGSYRRSFRFCSEKSLLIAMVTYANLFCFCSGAAVAVYKPNLIFAFPIVVVAVIAYFNVAISVRGAKLEPEELLKDPMVIGSTAVALVLILFLATTPLDLPSYVGFFRLIPGK